MKDIKTDNTTETIPPKVQRIIEYTENNASICINIIEFTDMLKWVFETLKPETMREVLMTGFYASLNGCKIWVSAHMEPGTIRCSYQVEPKIPKLREAVAPDAWKDWSEPEILDTIDGEDEPSEETSSKDDTSIGGIVGLGLAALIGSLAAAAAKSEPVKTEQTPSETNRIKAPQSVEDDVEPIDTEAERAAR